MTKSVDIGLAPGSDTTSVTAPKKSGKFKDLISLASTALPIAGAIGTIGVWLAATFYVGEIQVTPDQPFNTLEVRVSDKKGQESVFHTPHFQLMPGQYHLEVTVDSQFKHHEDIKAAFHKNTNIAVHMPASAAVPGAEITSMAAVTSTAATKSTAVTTSATDEDWGSEPGDTSKKHWWQFWKKSTPNK